MKKISTLIISLATLTAVSQPAGWLYNMPIAVYNPNTVTIQGYQLRITVNTQSLISLGMMQNSGNDIRFTGACTSNTFYSYWIESGMNTSTTSIWVKIPTLTANATTTMYMAYGNGTATAVSSIPNTFRGPNSSTDSVSGGNTNTVSNSQRGFRFSPNQNILVTDFGKNEPTGTPRAITLFNYTSTAIVAQTTVSGTSATYSYSPVAPMWLTAGTQYVLQQYQGSGEGYYYMNSTSIGQHLTYLDMRYCNSCTQNTFPTSMLTNIHYGYPDLLYYIATTVAIAPTYSYVSTGQITNSSSVPALCSGSSATLVTNTPGATNYSWSTGSTASSIVVQPTVNTTYSVTLTNSVGCKVTAITNITVNTAPPTLTVTASSASICLGQTATLTASGAVSYTWTGGVTNGQSFAPAATGNYTVYSANGCGTASAVTGITVGPLPIAAVASPTSICASNPAVLTAAGAPGYTWNPGGLTGGTVTVAPPVTTIYTVTASDGTCSGMTTLTLDARPNPTLSISGSATVICAGEPVTIAVSGAVSYTWSPSVLSGTGGIAYPSSPTLFQVTGTNSVGCTAMASHIVVANPAPTVTAVSNKPYVCSGGAATLTATGANTYSWVGGTGGSTYAVNPASSSVFTVVGYYSSTNCSDSAQVPVNVFTPVVPVGPSTAVCLGSAVTLTAGPALSYTWSTGSNFAVTTATPNTTTVYSLSATTNSYNISCQSSSTVQVQVNNNPTVTAVASRTAMCRNESVTLTASGASGYQWSNNQSSASSTFTSTVIKTHIITVTGTDANGCSATASVQVKVNSCTALVGLDPDAGFSVFPNPSDGTFFITSAAPAQLRLVNALGQLVRAIDLNASNGNKVTVSGLSKGVYFIAFDGDIPGTGHKIVVE